MFHGDGYDGNATTSMWLYEMMMASAAALHKDDGQRLCHGHGSVQKLVTMNDKTDLVVSLSFRVYRKPREPVRSCCIGVFAAAMETPTIAMMHGIHRIGRLRKDFFFLFFAMR